MDCDHAAVSASGQSFAAVLLAGGQSRRMGRDKGLLLAGVGASLQPLWKRQLWLLRSLAPDRVIISGQAKPYYPEGIELLEDKWPGAGPLGGLATCLEVVTQPFALILAIDLPMISADFLTKLLSLRKSGAGIVPQTEHGFDPLAAIYPIAALPVALRRIQTRDYRLQDFVAELVRQGLVSAYPVSPREKKLLRNWNWPNDAPLRFDPENRE